MPLTKISFAPGIRREGTQFSEQGSWYNCDKIRFRGRYPEKIGGWQQYVGGGFRGVVRALFNWSLLDGKDCLAVGTNKKIYIEQGGRVNNITPARLIDTNTNAITTQVGADKFLHTYKTSAPHGAIVGDSFTITNAANVDGICTSTATNPFTTGVIGSGIVTVSGFAHFAVPGDTVTISGATTVDGITNTLLNTSHTIIATPSPTSFTIQVAGGATNGFVTGGGSVSFEFLSRLNREFQVVAVPAADEVTFRTQTPCITGGITGGGTTTALFELDIGVPFNILGTGWGAGYWSRGAWGGPSSIATTGIALRVWAIDNYGEDLIFCVRDGPIYLWDATNGFNTRGQSIALMPGASDVPAQASIVLVTEDRHVVAVGATNRLSSQFDPLLIRWSDQEDYLNWTPSITTTAGAIRISSGSFVMAALKTRQETLIWTDTSLHSLQFTGPPYTFSLQTLDENTNIVGPKAAVTVNGVTYWMGTSKFWAYSGRVEPLPCDVQRFVFSNLNRDQAAQTYAFANEEFSEVTWLYCDKTTNQVNRYVTFNYEQRIWYYGTMARTAMLVCAGRGALPYGAGGGYSTDDARLFIHEVGYDNGETNPPSPIFAFVESADFNVADGDKLIFADRVIPDVDFSRSTSATPRMQMWLQAKRFPGSFDPPITIRTFEKAGLTSNAQTLTPETRQVWVRMRGREMRLFYTSFELGVAWLAGDLRMNIRQDGRQ